MQEDSNKKKNKKSEEEPQKESNEYLRELTQEKYKYGFTTDIHTDIIEKGLNEDVIRLISA
jgi:Fe-S cluster assembly protein SufB